MVLLDRGELHGACRRFSSGATGNRVCMKTWQSHLPQSHDTRRWLVFIARDGNRWGCPVGAAMVAFTLDRHPTSQQCLHRMLAFHIFTLRGSGVLLNIAPLSEVGPSVAAIAAHHTRDPRGMSRVSSSTGLHSPLSSSSMLMRPKSCRHEKPNPEMPGDDVARRLFFVF